MIFPDEYHQKEYNAFVSFDGDADRIVELYYFHLLFI